MLHFGLQLMAMTKSLTNNRIRHEQETANREFSQSIKTQQMAYELNNEPNSKANTSYLLLK